MIGYAIDTHERERVYFVCAGVSLGIMYIIGHFKTIPFVQLLAPSALVVFGLVVAAYEFFVWRAATFLGLSDIPNLNGDWVGHVTKNNGQSFTATMHITQTWKNIAVELETETTTSTVLMSTLFISNKKLKVLKLVYDLKPKHLALDSNYNPRGEGVNELRIRKTGDKTTMEGWYFSSNYRGGQLVFSREKRGRSRKTEPNPAAPSDQKAQSRCQPSIPASAGQ